MKNFFFLFLVFLSTTAFALTETIKVAVTEKGFEPSVIKVDSKKETILSVTRKTDSTCAKDIVFISKKIKRDLPLNTAVAINLGKLPKGEVKFSCGMDMVSGVINVQ